MALDAIVLHQYDKYARKMPLGARFQRAAHVVQHNLRFLEISALSGLIQQAGYNQQIGLSDVLGHPCVIRKLQPFIQRTEWNLILQYPVCIVKK